jgi:putative addiction module component (TIGR02574 family)
MAAQTDALRSEVLALPETERAQLAVELLDSLDDRPVETDQAELDRLWADETARRARQIDSGEVTTDSWDDVLAKVEQARRAR